MSQDRAGACQEEGLDGGSAENKKKGGRKKPEAQPGVTCSLNVLRRLRGHFAYPVIARKSRRRGGSAAMKICVGKRGVRKKSGPY